MKIAKTIFTWLVGILFILTGLMKLLKLDSMSIEIFARAHYPTMLFYLAGLFELAGGILLLTKSYKRLGASLIAVIMLGAIFTHLYLKDAFGHLIVPVLLLIYAAIIVRKSK
ncbi:MAG TPA: DoxX family protein [Cytophagaceae bacterium]|jgi:uncharacterized membrane protein YphA (DoxX/SURF4 family)|nr:DoxX family protein [Cytophagaceae bacterium]